MEAGWNSGTCAASHVCAEAEGQKGVNGAGEDGTDRQLALLTSQQRQAFCLVEMAGEDGTDSAVDSEA
jgi:hypothetical protein